MTIPYEELKRLVERRRKLIAQHQQKLAEFLAQCPHTELEQQEIYYSGSYLDRARTDYWNQCKLCGARSEITTESHTWYG